MKNHKLYSVSASGEILPGFTVAKVKRNLSNLFSIEENMVEPLFSDNYCFLKTNLDRLTAEEYMRDFIRSGLKANLSSMPDVQVSPESISPESITPDICPKCFAPKTSEINCDSCGIYFDKFRKTVKSDDSAADGVEPELTNVYENAKTLLRLGVLILTVVFIVDNYLTELDFLEYMGVNVGVWPYVVGHMVFSVGSFMYAQARGVKGVLLIISLFSIIGLSMVLLLSSKKHEGTDREETDQKKTGQEIWKIRGIAIVVLLVSIFWLVQQKHEKADLLSLYQLVEESRELRSSYPAELQGDLYKAIPLARDKLFEVVDRSFEMLAEYELNSDEVSEVSRTMFKDATDFILWLQYQRYLYHSVKKTIPDALDNEYVDRQKVAIYKYIVDSARDELPARFSQEFQRWRYGYSMYSQRDDIKKLSKISSGLNTGLLDFYSDTKRSTYDKEASNQGSEKKYMQGLSISLPETMSYNIEGDYLMITVKGREINETEDSNVILAFYWHISSDKFGKKKQTWYFNRVGGNLPNAYFSNTFNVFSHFGNR